MLHIVDSESRDVVGSIKTRPKLSLGHLHEDKSSPSPHSPTPQPKHATEHRDEKHDSVNPLTDSIHLGSKKVNYLDRNEKGEGNGENVFKHRGSNMHLDALPLLPMRQ
eukprot:1046128-Amorphochlora_amoeboformis.AAC.1